MAVDSEEEVVEDVVALSVQQRLSNVIKFNNNKYSHKTRFWEKKFGGGGKR